ncbi:MAG: PEP-CTERM sorting domain-containing protein [Phycisphaerales bacterium]|nr:PEP-CTERM sorting domain-containing protein [Phycisphaerales bacterium]
MRKFLLATIALTGVLSAPAMADSWVEVDDAPDGVPAAQHTDGTGPLTSILGRLNRGAGDHVDTYSIIITDPAEFFATTKIDLGGSATTSTGGNADTRLWLWTEQGAPVLANDDINAFGSDTLASLISDPSTFPTLSGGEVVAPTAAQVSLTPGKYLISISLFSNDPDDGVGEEVFNLGADFDALHGPDPAAGPFAAWENPASTTIASYTIALRGATFCVPEPASASLLAIGLAALGLRRRS